MIPALITAAATAFTEEGAVDLRSTTAIFAHVVEAGVEAILVNGTTGEFPSLSRSERRDILAAAIDVAGGDKVIAHVGASSAYEAAKLTEDALSLGARSLAAITPYFMPAGEAEVRSYFEEVQKAATGTPLFGYLFPARTNVIVSPEFAAQLVDEFGLAGMKLSVPGVEYLKKLVSIIAPAASVYSGNDGLIPEVHAAGGAGVVSGVSSATPAPFVAMSMLVRTNVEHQLETKAIVDTSVSLLGPSISCLKEALRQQGVISSSASRMAANRITSDQQQEIAALIDMLSRQSLGALS
jgi:4-hydroxy-tetrahydrodipicolinate synthase